ncbi:MAG: hypothetical protein QG629_386 [Patescibacteria group bacterium]|nr:hypothetical protein [Patescibacteria group bacterium]
MIRKARILVLAHSPSQGGAERALQSLIKSCPEYYWEIVFPVAPFTQVELVDGIDMYHQIPLPWWCYEANSSPQPTNRKELNNSLEALSKLVEKADVLLTNTITIPWLGFIARELNKPHIWYIHEFGDIDHNLQFIGGYENSIKTIGACSNRILTISTAVKAHLSTYVNAEQIDIIHQSVDLKNLLKIPMTDKPAYQSLLCLGAIKPSKGQLIALNAVQSLPGSNFSLDICGPNANDAYLQQLLKSKQSDHVRIVPGFSPQVELLSSHDIVLMCSDNEALGRVTLEALAAGKLVIGYDCLSTRDLLGDNRGILYSPNTSKALATVLSNVATIDTVDRQKARKFVEEVYSSKRQSKDFTSCLVKARNRAIPKTNPQLTAASYIGILDALGVPDSSEKTFSQSIRSVAARVLSKRVKNLLKSFLER